MKIELPTISNYGQYSSSNYGAHCLVVTVGPVTVWFSYSTPVAFRTSTTDMVVCENRWGPTTGKHLNWIDGGNKSRRVDRETFEQLWSQHIGV